MSQLNHHYGWTDSDAGDRPKEFHYLNEKDRGEKIIRHVKHTAIKFNGEEIEREYPASLKHRVKNPYVSLADAPVPLKGLLISSLGKDASFYIFAAINATVSICIASMDHFMVIWLLISITSLYAFLAFTHGAGTETKIKMSSLVNSQ